MGGACARANDNVDSMLEPSSISRPKQQTLASSQALAAPSLTKQDSLTFKGYKSFKSITNIGKLYKVGKELGHGSFGSVFEATQKATEMKVAIKQIKK